MAYTLYATCHLHSHPHMCDHMCLDYDLGVESNACTPDITLSVSSNTGIMFDFTGIFIGPFRVVLAAPPIPSSVRKPG